MVEGALRGDSEVPAASTKLAPFVQTLTQALKIDAHRPRHERRSVLALFAGVRASGYDGGYSRLTDFIRAWRQDEGKAAPVAGKTYLATAIGVAVITNNGKSVRFYSTVDLVNALEREKAEGACRAYCA